MSHGGSQVDAETVEVKIIDVNGMEFVFRMGEPGRRLHVDTALNIEYSDDFYSLSRYRYPESREFTVRVRF